MSRLVLDRRVFLTGGLALLATAGAASAHGDTVHVTVHKMAFEPASVEVRAGQTIEWINKDPFAHTATVKDGWEVMLPPGKSATHVVRQDDSVSYYCRFHPNMTGTITVIG
ncbi:cupredoxin domain-containing protein [Aquamicrobium ahrensii]|uniref:Plastocyanin n=1 Tax=Aquamicrobium ahrensii TaxID=469551 RepID=A0ABV2KHM7_9HYPH